MARMLLNNFIIKPNIKEIGAKGYPTKMIRSLGLPREFYAKLNMF